MTIEDTVQGLGIDLVEIDRIRKSVQEHKERLLDRLFTAKERDYFSKYKDPTPQIAGRFAAKEAVAKALGCGFGHDLSWQEFEILNDERGKPHVYLSSLLQTKFPHTHLLISISHAELFATAIAMSVKTC